MENQIRVGEQNTQQIGQNPVSQPVQIPEKPKVNYWMISTLVLAVILMFGSFYTFNLKNQQGEIIKTTEIIDKEQAVTKNSIQPTKSLEVTDVNSNWKTYTNIKQGIEFKYPKNYYVHEISDSKFSIVLNESLEFQIPQGTDAPLYGIIMGLTGCTRPDIKQTYPCEKTPSDAITGINLRKYLVDNSIKTKETTISNRVGEQISGTISNENDAYIPVAGSFYKATYFSNNSTTDGEYLISVSLMEREQTSERIYDQILSTLKFTK